MLTRSLEVRLLSDCQQVLGDILTVQNAGNEEQNHDDVANVLHDRLSLEG
jgi:hypothetical protein